MLTGNTISYVKLFADAVFSKSTELLLANASKVDQVYDWLSDEYSKNIFKKELLFKTAQNLLGDEFAVKNCPVTINLDEWNKIIAELKINCSKYSFLNHDENDASYFNALCTNFLSNQYVYHDKVNFSKGTVFIDCGAYIGDTAVWSVNYAKERGVNDISVYSFEPVKENFNYLVENTQIYPNIKALPFGVANSDSKQLFTSSQSHSRLSSQGTEEVEVVTLDTFCGANNIIPTYIKMDIEGAEPLALLGAKDIITQHKPNLAICIYHNLSDMWTIPHIIKSFVPEYKLYCNKHSYLYETVLYATVK